MLPLCRGVVGVFYSPSQLGNILMNVFDDMLIVAAVLRERVILMAIYEDTSALFYDTLVVMTQFNSIIRLRSALN